MKEKVLEILRRIGIDERSIKALSIHGSFIDSDPPIIFAIIESLKQIKILREDSRLIFLTDEKSAVRDASEEDLGGVIAHIFLYPYRVIFGQELLKRLEKLYKRHVMIESLQNIVLEHRLASTNLIVKPEYFLYDKLKRLSTIYPPSREFMRKIFENLPEDEFMKIVKGFWEAADELINRGIIRKKMFGISPTQEFVDKVLSRRALYGRISGELEHLFKLYLSPKFSSPIDALRNVRFDLDLLSPVKLPDPSQMIYVETSIGPQPLMIDLGIREFLSTTYGVEKEEIGLKKIGGVFNSTYLASLNIDGREEKIFIKKYLNWTDFKWIAAWLWAIGVKNFSVLASSRMSKEIYFINKLAELGFNTAEILHVNWPKKILFQRYIKGMNGLQALKNPEKFGGLQAVSYRMGEILGEVHGDGICIGDCNPFTFIFGDDDKIYLIDLEQCSFGESKSWDLCELLFYTAHYLESKSAEKFAESLVKGYLKNGDGETVREALDPKFSRIFLPWTPIWIQFRIRKIAMEILNS